MKRRFAKQWLGSLAFALAACQASSERVTLRLELPRELLAGEKQLRVVPAIAEGRRELGRGVVALELKQRAGRVSIELPGACPLQLDTRTLPRDRVTTRALEPWFDLGPSARVVGLDSGFELVARPRCRAAEAARTGFRVTRGAELVEVAADGRRFAAKTKSAAPPRSRAHGIVPVSAHDKLKLTTEVTFRAELAGQTHEQQLEVAAVARSSGLPNVGLSHPLLLSADDWRLFDKPSGSRAELREVGVGLQQLRPDLPGKYRLVDAAGLELSIQSARFDRTPLDCGRADCHAAVAKSARDSPMTKVLESDLGGCHSLSDASCAVACHTTGEPGTTDGGFSQVAAELGIGALPLEHEDLARDLQRLGGVGCMACHGPAAIPEPSARFNVLRSDVCAVCHDAPPRYQHVQSLARSRMAHADGDPRTREGACARCHTSWGALDRPAPPASALRDGFGITCTTCHDVHPSEPAPKAGGPTHGGLLRALVTPPSLPAPPASFTGVSRVCVGCHAPSSESALPEASAALIVAGQGGHDPASGAALDFPSPHAADPRGCLSCHQNIEGGVLGKGHDFRATDATCSRCHEKMPERSPALARRAKSLLERLAPELVRASPGAWHAAAWARPADASRAQALRNVLLVLEDPAADVHHPRYAGALLDAAERALGAP